MCSRKGKYIFSFTFLQEMEEKAGKKTMETVNSVIFLFCDAVCFQSAQCRLVAFTCPYHNNNIYIKDYEKAQTKQIKIPIWIRAKPFFHKQKLKGKAFDELIMKTESQFFEHFYLTLLGEQYDSLKYQGSQVLEIMLC